MSWQYLQGQEEVSSPGICWDGGAFAPSKTTTTLAEYCLPDNETGACPDSRSGMTLRRSGAWPGVGAWMWFRGDSPVRTYQPPDAALDSAAHGADFGFTWPESSAKYSPSTYSWRTRQCSLLGGLESFSATWPRWGTMRNGECWARPMPFGLMKYRKSITSVIEYGLSLRVPTPTVHGNYNRQGASPTSGDGLETYVRRFPKRFPTPVADDAVERQAGKVNSREEPKLSAQVKRFPTPRTPSATGGGTGLDGGAGARSMLTDAERGEFTGGSLNPTWVEWLMGWPLGWTSMEPMPQETWDAWRSAFQIAPPD